MYSLQRVARSSQLNRFSSLIFNSIDKIREFSSNRNRGGGDDEWNDAWETAWLPEEVSGGNAARAPWESDVNFSSSPDSAVALPQDADAETKAFVEEMNENWSERRKASKSNSEKERESGSLYSLENMKKDYRLKKQRIHAGLWTKEIEKQEEAKLGDSVLGAGDDIEKLLDSCSEYVSLFFFFFFNFLCSIL